MCRRTEEEVGPTVGLPCHRHFVGFFNVPVLAPTRDHPFYTVIPTHRPISRLLRSRWGYGGHIIDFTPRALTGALIPKTEALFYTELEYGKIFYMFSTGKKRNNCPELLLELG